MGLSSPAQRLLLLQAWLTAKAIREGKARDRARGYKPRGTVIDLMTATDEEVLSSGPAGTGKSRGVLEKINAIMWMFPMSRALIVRKTRRSLTESGLFTLEVYVLGVDNPIVTNGPRRAHREKYVYPNGSEIVVGGLDAEDKLMSTEFDIVYVMEAIETTENDWEKLKTRLRNFKVPFQQIIGDTNPGPPTHWLKQREKRGVLRMINSRHKDNPLLWDERLSNWTVNGRKYLLTLRNLSGVRFKRLFKGQWAAAEGAIYDEWNPEIHLINPFDIPETWRRFRVVDFGFVNPFVCQWWAVDEDGRMYLYREIYYSHRIVADHAEDIREWSVGEDIEITITDHDAEDQATLRKEGIPTKPAYKAVLPGIEAVQKRLRVQLDGRARLYIFRDARVELDVQLAEEKKPTCTAEEIEGYVWKKSPEGKPDKDEPDKKDDHGVDAIRYAVAYNDRVAYGPKKKARTQ